MLWIIGLIKWLMIDDDSSLRCPEYPCTKKNKKQEMQLLFKIVAKIQFNDDKDH